MPSQTNEVVAIKKIRLGKLKEGVNFTAIREIKLLQEIKHEHVIELVDVFAHKKNLNLVFEYCGGDLEMVIKDKATPLSAGEVKSYVRMTLRAVAHCHENWVLHRDLKPNNLLIAPNGCLKLADFGLARILAHPIVGSPIRCSRGGTERPSSCSDRRRTVQVWTCGRSGAFSRN